MGCRGDNEVGQTAGAGGDSMPSSPANSVIQHLLARKEGDGRLTPEVTDFKVVEKFDDTLFEQP
jgi:hypothetical protein